MTLWEFTVDLAEKAKEVRHICDYVGYVGSARDNLDTTEFIVGMARGGCRFKVTVEKL